MSKMKRRVFPAIASQVEIDGEKARAARANLPLAEDQDEPESVAILVVLLFVVMMVAPLLV